MTDDKHKHSGKPEAEASDATQATKTTKATPEQDSTLLAKIEPIEEKLGADADVSPPPPPQPVASNSSGFFQRLPWLASLAIILVIAVGLMSLQNSQQAGQLQTMQQKAAQLDQQLLQEQQKFNQQLATLQSSLQQNQAQNEKMQSELSTAQRDRFDLEEKIKQVSLQASAKGRDPLKWRLAEIEYLLSLANNRLILSQDHITALTALNDADKRLRTIADPGLSQIRMTIANEIKLLQSVQVPDIAGMAMKLSALVDGIGQLPLVNRERMLTHEKSGIGQEVDSWDQIPAAIWRDIKGLVTVRRSDLSIEPILPPDELHYLSQNLGLKIEQARLALLRKDTALFRSNLKDTGLWVSRYFDHDTAAVTNVIDTINALMSAEVVTSMPDISGSLRQLRRWRESQESAILYRPQHSPGFNPAAENTKLSVRPATIKADERAKTDSIASQKKQAELASTKPNQISQPAIDPVIDPVINNNEKSAIKLTEPAPINNMALQSPELKSTAEPIKPQSDQGLASTTGSASPVPDDPLSTINSESDLSTASQTGDEAVTTLAEEKPSEETP